jgi:ferredoxin
MQHNWAAFNTLFIALFVMVIVMGGPLTVFVIVKIANSFFGGVKVRFLRTLGQKESPIGMLVEWDNESFPLNISRVKVDFSELVQGGRSTSFSFTFEDRAAKKRSFFVPMKLPPADLKMLVDGGHNQQAKVLDRSLLSIEVEDVKGNVVRRKLKKRAVVAALQEQAFIASKEIEALPPTAPDAWGTQSRVFPWRKEVLVEAGGEKAHKEKKPKAAGGPAKILDFVVTKVWIEPGCIVCDACENEAPAVFQVLSDTCIVRENAPLDDAASIVAAAEGCPVDVIKYDRAAKSA